MSNSKQKLAHSPHFEILHEYETVWLSSERRALVVIGGIYGAPNSAIIYADERWCAVVGLGVIVHFIEKPFQEYEYGRLTNQ